MIAALKSLVYFANLIHKFCIYIIVYTPGFTANLRYKPKFISIIHLESRENRLKNEGRKSCRVINTLHINCVSVYYQFSYKGSHDSHAYLF